MNIGCGWDVTKRMRFSQTRQVGDDSGVRVSSNLESLMVGMCAPLPYRREHRSVSQPLTPDQRSLPVMTDLNRLELPSLRSGVIMRSILHRLAFCHLIGELLRGGGARHVHI